MLRPHLKAFAVLAVLTTTSLLGHGLTPTIKVADSRPKTTLDQIVPLAFGNWILDASSPLILPAADVQARLDKVYNQVLARTYVNKVSGYRVMLSLAYGGDQSDGLSVHRPEACYPAQGFEVHDIKQVKLDLKNQSIPATILLTRLDKRIEPVTYWVVNGDIPIGSRFGGRMVQLQYSFKGLIPDGMLIRLSSIDPNASQAFSIQREFASALATSLPLESRRRFGFTN